MLCVDDLAFTFQKHVKANTSIAKTNSKHCAISGTNHLVPLKDCGVHRDGYEGKQLHRTSLRFWAMTALSS